MDVFCSLKCTLHEVVCAVSIHLPPKKLHYKPFTFHFIVYICIQKEISINPIHVGLYVGFGGINEIHTLIINDLSSELYQNTSHYSSLYAPL